VAPRCHACDYWVLCGLQVQEATSAWLSEIAGSCSRHGLQLLQQCADADSLLEAQLAVHTAMAEWTAPSSDDAAAEDAESRGEQTQSAAAAAASRLSRVASLAAGGSPGGSPIVRGRAAAAAVVSDWVLTCQAVLGQSLDLWQVSSAAVSTGDRGHAHGWLPPTQYGLTSPQPHTKTGAVPRPLPGALQAADRVSAGPGLQQRAGAAACGT
jgi:hypothetical protein